MTREARQLAYVGVLIDLTGLDGEELSKRPPDEQFLVLLKAVEERGVTLQDVAGWVALCDPEGTEPPAGFDPVECFRTSASAAMAEPPTLARTVLVWGGLSAVAAYLGARFVRRR